MKYYVDGSLADFHFWGGAEDRAALLTTKQLTELDDKIDELLPEDRSDTDINDLFWYDFESVCSLIGLYYIDGEVVKDLGEWKMDIVTAYDPTLSEIYGNDFIFTDGEVPADRQDVVDAFVQYIEDYWRDHASEVLENEFPTASQDQIDEFLDNLWRTDASDEENIGYFKETYE